MNSFNQLVSWRRTITATVVVLSLLIILDFYSLYTNSFYFLQPANYLFPLVTLFHFIFLYVLKFKISEGELTDPMMRNVEYMLYGSLLVYIYKASETLFTLTTYNDFANHVLPTWFVPLGLLVFILHLALLTLTILAIHYRKELIGDYEFNNLNRHIDTWEQN